MTFPHTFLLLQQEGFLIETFLAQGLTALRTSGAHGKGALYRASFQLSIGIERLMKMIAVINHMAENSGNPPHGKDIRAYGHDFDKLSEVMKPISAKVGGDPFVTVLSDPLNRRIFDLIGEYGRGDVRYFNLQALATGKDVFDPFARWHNLFDTIIETDVSSRRKRKAISNGELLGPSIDRVASVIMHDLRGDSQTARSVIERQGLESDAARHAVWRVMQILHSLKEMLNSVGDKVWIEHPNEHRMPRIPYMREFFAFITDERNEVINKKRWP